jgi:predicted Co/Zn/Cd cation transporter (cation efflux family)
LTDRYTYDPNTWPPALAGVVAGATGAIVAAIFGRILTEGVVEQPHGYANSLTVVIVSLVLGWISGLLWRKLRASDNASKTFSWTIAGAFFVTLAAVLIVDRTVLSSLVPYAVPLVAIIFITLAFFTPLLSRVTAPKWTAAIPILLALATGIGLFL